MQKVPRAGAGFTWNGIVASAVAVSHAPRTKEAPEVTRPAARSADAAVQRSAGQTDSRSFARAGTGPTAAEPTSRSQNRPRSGNDLAIAPLPRWRSARSSAVVAFALVTARPQRHYEQAFRTPALRA